VETIKIYPSLLGGREFRAKETPQAGFV